MAGLPPNLDEWTFVKERGALARNGCVYRSSDGKFYLRTGERTAIRDEAEFGQKIWQLGFPVPEVTEIGRLPDETAYFVEASAGDENYGDLLNREYVAAGSIPGVTFDAFCAIVVRFLDAQIKRESRQTGPTELRAGIQLANVQQQNPESADLFEQAVAKVEGRASALPLVLTHGDLSPFNVLPSGIIDFEARFVAPFGLDAVTAIAFQRFWGHPRFDGTGTMQLWDFDSNQIARFIAQVDALCASRSIPPLSGFFDDFLMLKAIWALSYERPDDLQRPQVQRWQWRKRVAVYCAECALADTPIESEQFRAIGLKETDD